MSSDYVINNECPHCHYSTDRATGINADRAPDDGDLSLCLRCGEWSVFTSSGIRPPTDDEYAIIGEQTECRQAREAWTKMDRERNGRSTTH